MLQQRALVPRSNDLEDSAYSWQSRPSYFAPSRTLQTRHLMARGGSRPRPEHLPQLVRNACMSGGRQTLPLHMSGLCATQTLPLHMSGGRRGRGGGEVRRITHHHGGRVKARRCHHLKQLPSLGAVPTSSKPSSKLSCTTLEILDLLASFSRRCHIFDILRHVLRSNFKLSILRRSAAAPFAAFCCALRCFAAAASIRCCEIILRDYAAPIRLGVEGG